MSNGGTGLNAFGVVLNYDTSTNSDMYLCYMSQNIVPSESSSAPNLPSNVQLYSNYWYVALMRTSAQSSYWNSNTGLFNLRSDGVFDASTFGTDVWISLVQSNGYVSCAFSTTTSNPPTFGNNANDVFLNITDSSPLTAINL